MITKNISFGKVEFWTKVSEKSCWVQEEIRLEKLKEKNQIINYGIYLPFY